MFEPGDLLHLKSEFLSAQSNVILDKSVPGSFHYMISNDKIISIIYVKPHEWRVDTIETLVVLSDGDTLRVFMLAHWIDS